MYTDSRYIEGIVVLLMFFLAFFFTWIATRSMWILSHSSRIPFSLLLENSFRGWFDGYIGEIYQNVLVYERNTKKMALRIWRFRLWSRLRRGQGATQLSRRRIYIIYLVTSTGSVTRVMHRILYTNNGYVRIRGLYTSPWLLFKLAKRYTPYDMGNGRRIQRCKFLRGVDDIVYHGDVALEIMGWWKMDKCI